MNHFGHMADDLTSLEMSIDKMLDLPHAKTLKAALQRAFVEACKASRAQRLIAEGGDRSAEASLSRQTPALKPVAAKERFDHPVFKDQSNGVGC